jgi:SAM-dependent methyltransferase
VTFMHDLAPPGMQTTYNPDHFDSLFAAEDGHFWFRSRNRCIMAAIQSLPDFNCIKDVIEHGCGTGYVLARLHQLLPTANVVGADLFAEGLALARRRFAGTLLQTDLFQCSFRSAFDLVGLFDVLEHLDDDIAALCELRKQLRPKGRLLLTVPAHMVLWSNYDSASDHRRRYSRGLLCARLSEAGFRVEYCTEFMCALFPVMLLRRRLLWGNKHNGAAPLQDSGRMNSELQVHPLINRTLEAVLRPEAYWIRRRGRLPLGTSLLAIAAPDL